MTTRFAGSRCVDERRRRRLAGEADEMDTAAKTVSLNDHDDTDSADDKSAAADELSAGDVLISHFPVSRLISPKLWKLWAVGILGLLTGVNLLVAGSTPVEAAEQFGPGFAYLFNLEAGRAVGPFATIMLLVSAQLAWFIWWVRSCSPHDFDGRYRVWCLCAVLGLGATLTFACDLHLAWAMTAKWLWDYSFWKHETLIWLAPMALASLLALRALHHEMRDCRTSLTLLWLAAISAAGVAAMQLGLVSLPLAANEILLVNWGVKLTACWFLSMSMLLHARHVVHVTPDPARRRPGLLRFASLIRLPKLPRQKRKAKPAAASQDSESADEPKEPKHKPARKARKPAVAQKSTPDKADDNKSDESPTVADTSNESNEDDQPSADTDEQTPVETSQGDEESTSETMDAQSMQGLSKRERRRLRKQQRAEQRASKSVRRAG